MSNPSTWTYFCYLLVINVVNNRTTSTHSKHEQEFTLLIKTISSCKIKALFSALLTNTPHHNPSEQTSFEILCTFWRIVSYRNEFIQSVDMIYIKTQVFRLLRYYSPAPMNIARSDWATQNVTHSMTSSILQPYGLHPL